MRYLRKAAGANGSFRWQIGQIIVATAAVTSTTEAGLFLFSINGVHRQPELFSTHARAEALLQRHLGAAVRLGEAQVAQRVEVARDDRWAKLRCDDPPEHEEDTYTYTIGNVVLASLANIKRIRESGYHFRARRAGSPDVVRALTITEGEAMLIQALASDVVIRRRSVSFVVGANDEPGESVCFSCRPTLYDGRPAW